MPSEIQSARLILQIHSSCRPRLRQWFPVIALSSFLAFLCVTEILHHLILRYVSCSLLSNKKHFAEQKCCPLFSLDSAMQHITSFQLTCVSLAVDIHFGLMEATMKNKQSSLYLTVTLIIQQCQSTFPSCCQLSACWLSPYSHRPVKHMVYSQSALELNLGRCKEIHKGYQHTD